MNKGFKFNLFLTLFFVLLPLMVMIPLSSNHKIPLNHDYFNHLIAIIQAKLELMRGQFPLRVMNETHPQWFYPYYQFYSSTSYTFAGYLHWFFSPKNPLIAFKLTLFCALFVGGLYMYRLCLWLFQSTTIAIACSGVFINSVYFNILINHLGAFNEAVAVALLPPTFFYTLQQLYHPERQWTLLQMAICWYLLATVHLITFALASILYGLCIILICFCKPARPLSYKKNCFLTLLGYLFGCLLAAWYLGPIIKFSPYLNIRHTFINSGTFFATTPTLASLLSPIGHIADVLQQAPKPGRNLNTIFLIHPNIGLPILTGFFVSLFVFIKYRKLPASLGGKLLPVFLILFSIIFFIIWSPFNFWQWLPDNFRFMQYSWRFLGQLTLIGTLLFGASLLWLFETRLTKTHVLAIVVFIFVSNFYWYTHLQVFGHYEKKISKSHISNNYLIDAKKYFSEFNPLVDYFTLEDKELNRKPLTLKEVKPLIIKTLDNNTPQQIQIIGKVANNSKLNQEKLALLVNGRLIKSYPLTSTFNLTFKLDNKNFPQVSSFKVIGPDKKMTFKDIPIEIDSIRLTGYLNSNYIVDVEKVKPFCQLLKTDLVCHLKEMKNKLIVELPVYYYPAMLRIFLNKTQINYKSIYYGSYLIPYVKPVANIPNTLQVQFIGLDWANYISLVFWAVWGIFIVYLSLRYLTSPRR